MNRRFLLVSGFLALGAALTVISFVARTNRTSGENMVRTRGQVVTQPPTVTLNRGRIGYEPDPQLGERTWTGTLVDAGCMDRDEITPGAPPPMSMPAVAGAPQATPSGGGGAEGVTVSGKTLTAERSVAAPQLVPDLRSRMMDPACSITGANRGLAILLPNGELKDLDEGGNTLAMQAFESSLQGQAVLNGKAPGAKPNVTVTGVDHGDRIVVSKVKTT
jgi:hypothetical protein